MTPWRSPFADALRPLLAPVVWTLYLLAPVAGWGSFDGAPLGPAEAFVVAAVWWVWAANRQLPAAALIALLLAAKLAGSLILIDRGLAAHYYANESWRAPAERSAEFPRTGATRIDERLAFGDGDQPDLPLHFFNDLRFNFYQPGEPERERLAYSVQWEGAIEGTSAERTVYMLGSDGVHATIAIDGDVVVELASGTSAEASVRVADGWHRLQVRVAAPYGSGRRVEAGEIIDGGRRPFDGRSVYLEPVGALRQSIDASLRWISTAVDWMVMALLATVAARRVSHAWRDGRWRWILFGGAIAEALLFALPRAGRVVTLTGGDDWLIYESFARAIVSGDVLLREATAGQPFYAQAGYPYVLALIHLAFGDGTFGILFVQRVLIAATVAAMSAVTRHLFGTQAGWIMVIGGGAATYAIMGRWARILLTEGVFVPLLAYWVWLLVSAVRSPAVTSAAAIVIGVVGGLATLIRATLLLAWALVLPAWGMALRSRRARTIAAVVAVMAAVLGTATMRNWVVAGAFVPVTSSFGSAFYLGNTPAQPLDPTPARRADVYARIGLAGPTSLVVEYAIQRPAAFVGGLGRKTLYMLGFFGASGLARPGQNPIGWVYVAIWCTAAIGVSRLWRSRALSPLILLPAMASLSHMATLVVMYPDNYTDRLLLAGYILALPYSAFALAPLVTAVRETAPRMAAVAAITALTGLVFLRGSPTSLDVTAWIVMGSLVLALALGGRPTVTRRSWVYLAFAGVVVLAFAAAPVVGSREDFRAKLLLPVVVFTVARLARHDTTRRVGAAVLGVGALAGILLTGWGARVPQFERVELVDIYRGGVRALGGDAEAREELDADVTATIANLRQSAAGIERVLRNLSRALSPLAAVCLLFIYLQTWLATRSLDGATRLGVRAALAVPLVLAVFGVGPAEWDEGRDGYPMLALGVMFGLVESGPAFRAAADEPPRSSPMSGDRATRA